MTNVFEEIIDIFTEKLPSIFGGSGVRQHQVQMALDVADFLFNQRKKIMFVEAPVGTGKSLGLLIPCALYAREKEKDIIYATSTISLQNQIFNQDSTTLNQLGLIKDDEKILAQGKRNYLCESLVKSNIKKFNETELNQLNSFFSSAEYGLLSEFEDNFPKFPNKKLNCLAMNKYKENDCFCIGHKHRRRYTSLKYKLKITNQAQLIQSYSNLKEQRPPIINFDNGVIIIDEAHALKENFLSNIQQTTNIKNLPHIQEVFVGEDKEQYIEILSELATLQRRYTGSREESSMRYKINFREIKMLETLKDLLERMLLRIDSLLLRQHSSELSKHLKNIEELIDSLSAIFREDTKSWFTFGNDNIFINSVTMVFNKEFNNMIKRFPKNSKIIFMSGTLTTTKEVTQEMITNWGVKKSEYNYKAYPSVFELYEQSIIYIPKNFVSVHDEKHLENVEELLPDLINSSMGGSLVLCTAHAYVSEISNILKNDKRVVRTVLSQEERNSQYLTTIFKKDKDSILVGSGSFFTGFSVEGDALNKLFLTKLPYPVPNDPYIDLISEGYTFPEKMKKIIFPTMLVRLEQGLGRLIRSRTDYGFITIFDNRVMSDKFVYQFLKGLGYRITDNWSEIESFVKYKENNKEEVVQEQFRLELLSIPESASSSKQKRKPLSTEKRISSKNKIANVKRNNQLHSSDPSNNIKKKTGKRIVHIWNNPEISEVSVEELKAWFKAFVKENRKKNSPTVRVTYNKKNAQEFYQAAVNFCYKQGLSIERVSKTFPFQSHSQKEKFSRISPTVSGPVR